MTRADREAPVVSEGRLPARVVVGSNGAYWRDFGTHYSMPPVSEDNEPVQIAATYVRDYLDPVLDESITAVADALNAWDQGEEPRPDTHRHWSKIVAALPRPTDSNDETHVGSGLTDDEIEFIDDMTETYVDGTGAYTSRETVARLVLLVRRLAALATPVVGLREPLTGRDVHAAWRDEMLRQGREVAPERMAWATLTEQDRELDDRIAAILDTQGHVGSDR